MEDLASSWRIVVAQGTTPYEFIELNENQDFSPQMPYLLMIEVDT